MINDLRMRFRENYRVDEALHVDFFIDNCGLKSAILIESDQNLNYELKEKGFHGFKKKLLRKKGINILEVNEISWEDYSYQQKVSEIGRFDIGKLKFG